MADIPEKPCAWCGKLFKPSRRTARCCNKLCTTQLWRKEHPERLRESVLKTEAKQKADPEFEKRRYQQRLARLAANPELAARRKETKRRANQKWGAATIAERRPKIREYARAKYQEDLSFRIAHNHRCRVVSALRKQAAVKKGTSLELLGTSIEEARLFIESQFKEGMNWDNWAHDGWHLDHIRPCASFDLTDPEQQRQCFHYTNLQPLWAEDNLRKSDQWIEAA